MYKHVYKHVYKHPFSEEAADLQQVGFAGQDLHLNAELREAAWSSDGILFGFVWYQVAQSPRAMETQLQSWYGCSRKFTLRNGFQKQTKSGIIMC